MNIMALALIFGGLFFVLVSSLGLLRFPDFYTRSHALGKADTLGSILILLGMVIYTDLSRSSFKLLLILVFVAVGNPTAAHALTRAALRSGLEMWSGNKGAKQE